jgi:hypothetical protein
MCNNTTPPRLASISRPLAVVVIVIIVSGWRPGDLYAVLVAMAALTTALGTVINADRLVCCRTAPQK